MEIRIDMLKKKTGFTASSEPALQLAKESLQCTYKMYYLSDASDDYRFESDINKRYSLDFLLLYNAAYNKTIETGHF